MAAIVVQHGRYIYCFDFILFSTRARDDIILMSRDKVPGHSTMTVLPLRKKYQTTKGRFTRYGFAACDKFTTALRHELFPVNKTYNSLTTVVYVKKIVVRF